MEYKKLVEVGKCPCYQCPDRQDWCHVTCSNYLTWKECVDYNRKILQEEREEEKQYWNARFNRNVKRSRKNDK